MSGPARAIPVTERGTMSLEELAALRDDSPELDRVLPKWVADAHRQWLETGEGDPWGGYFK